MLTKRTNTAKCAKTISLLLSPGTINFEINADFPNLHIIFFIIIFWIDYIGSVSKTFHAIMKFFAQSEDAFSTTSLWPAVRDDGRSRCGQVGVPLPSRPLRLRPWHVRQRGREREREREVVSERWIHGVWDTPAQHRSPVNRSPWTDHRAWPLHLRHPAEWLHHERAQQVLGEKVRALSTRIACG